MLAYSGAKVQSHFYLGDLVTGTGAREIRSVSGRLRDYPRELACMHPPQPQVSSPFLRILAVPSKQAICTLGTRKLLVHCSVTLAVHCQYPLMHLGNSGHKDCKKFLFQVLGLGPCQGNDKTMSQTSNHLIFRKTNSHTTRVAPGVRAHDCLMVSLLFCTFVLLQPQV